MSVTAGVDSRLAILVVVAVPIALAAVVYREFIDLYFWTDDFIWLATPANLDAGSAIREAFAFPRGASPYWRPLVDVYFLGMERTVGFNATAYHVATLALHTASAIILGFLALRITRSAAVSALAAGLYVISPTYSTMIPWASGVTGALSGLFSVTLVFVFLLWLEEQRLRWLLLSAGALAGALLSKEDAAALPAVLVLVTLAVKQPRNLDELRALTPLVLPFVCIWLVYVIPQLATVVWSEETARFSIGWHAVPRLGIAMSWLSLPYPLWYADWVEPCRWIALGFFTTIAAVAAARRQWLLPTLYLSAVAMLLPSSFLTSDFAERWTYHASLAWALLVSIIFVASVQRLVALNVPLGTITGVAGAFMLIALLSGRAIDSGVWIPSTSDSYHQIERAVTNGCGDLREGGSVYIFPLPIGGPGFREHAVAELVEMVKPGSTAYRAGATNVRPPPPPAQPGDCGLTYSFDHEYVATIIE